MSQRSYTNERYRKDAKVGSTRKSAAKAKPVREKGSAQSTVTKAKPKKPEQQKDWAGLPTSPAIQKWRRVWWVLLGGGLAIIGATWLVPEMRTNEQYARIASLLVVVLSLAAISIDLVVIRRLRKDLMAAPAKKPKVTDDAKKSGKDDS
jgi:hypothetical protein